MKLIIAGMAILISGCSSIPDLRSQISISIACDELKGKMRSSCSIKVPSDTDVSINGETIEISFEGRK